MDEAQLRKLLNQPEEHAKLEFKREMYALKGQGSKKNWNEFIKDLIALANGNIGTANETGYLIIGAADKLSDDRTREIYDVGDINITKRQLLDRLDKYCDIPFQDLSCETSIINEKRIFIIAIPPSDYYYELEKDLDTKTKKFPEGSVLIRRHDGEKIYIASDKERARIRKDKKNRNSNESELYKQLTNYQYIETQVQGRKTSKLIKYYTDAFKPIHNISEEQQVILSWLQAALRRSKSIIEFDNSQIASQLIGRLSFLEDSEIKNLLGNIEELKEDQEACWLKPLSASLQTPVASLRHSIDEENKVIQAIAVNQRSSEIISALERQDLIAWDLNTGDYLRSWNENTAQINNIIVTPDDTKLISISDDYRLRVWDINNSDPLFSFEGHQAEINGTAITPDSEHLISVSDDKTLRIWDLKNSKACIREEVCNDAITSLTITDNGHCIAFSVDNAIHLLNIEHNTIEIIEEAHDSQITILTSFPKRNFIISASDDETLKVWDIDKKTCQKTLENYFIEEVNIIPDECLIVFSDDEKIVRVWKWETDNPETLDHDEKSVDTWTLASGGKQIITSKNQAIDVWDQENKLCMLSLRDHTDSVSEIIETPDGKHFVSTSQETIKIWDLLSRHELLLEEKHKSTVTSIKITPDGEHAISISDDNTLKVWQIRDGNYLHEFKADKQINDSIIKNQQVIFISDPADEPSFEGENDIFYIQNFLAENDKPVPFDNSQKHNGYISTIVYTPDNQYLISASLNNKKNLKVWDIETKTLYKNLLAHTDSVESLAINPEKEWLISASELRTVVWDLNDFKILYMFDGTSESLKQSNRSNNIQFFPKQDYRITENNSDLNIWNLSTGKILHTLREKDNAVTAIALSYDRKYLISTNNSNDLELWELGRDFPKYSTPAHNGPITSIVISPCDRYVVSTSEDYTLKVWSLEELLNQPVDEDSENGKGSYGQIATFTGDSEITTCAISPENIIVAGEKSGRVHFLELCGF
ncbi:MAG: hypothetical protein F6K11_06265 [Leptolyngbya sp. SIO3F4]|nr:hypothetical protein [Leptolyngbya sp. SIO3F4]